MNKITKIEIENVKGIKEKKCEFSDLYANKLNIFVAPNGYGKTSLTVAFESLNSIRLALNEKDYPDEDVNLNPQLSLEVYLDGEKSSLVADKKSNQISKKVDVAVIRPRVNPKAKEGFGNTRATPYLKHEDIELVKNIPKTTKLDYRKSTYNSLFKNNRNDVLDVKDFLVGNEAILLDLFQRTDLAKIKQVTPGKAIEGILKIEKNDCELEDVIDLLTKFDVLKVLFDSIRNALGESSIKKTLILLYQICSLVRADRKNFVRWAKKEAYKLYKKRVLGMVTLLNSTGREVAKVNERKETLVFTIKNLDKISKGQRDILSFVSQLCATEYELIYTNSKTHAIFIIDEIFDFLDETNLLAAQYYISKFIKDFKRVKKKIFPIIMTHLEPNEFRTFRLGDLKIHFLEPRKSGFKNADIRKMLIARSSYHLNKTMRDDLSHYFFHYHDEEFDNLPEIGLSGSFSKNSEFYTVVREELSNYLDNKSNYDPFSICIALRIELEKMVFEKLDEEEKKKFLRIDNGTDPRFDYAVSCQKEVPEIFYLLGILYNEALHAKEEQIKFLERKLSAHLENKILKNMLEEVFDG